MSSYLLWACFSGFVTDPAVQRQTTVTASYSSKQLLLFASAAQYQTVNLYSAVIDFRRQNLTSVDVRF